MLNGFIVGFDNRKDLANHNIYKIRLYQVLRNFDNYQTSLLELGVDTSLIKEADFKILMSLGGGVFTKWDDLQQSQIGVFLEIQRCLELREKKILIYNKTPEELLKNINTNNMYLTNENDEENNRKYLSSVNENITQASLLSQTQMLDLYLNNLINPNQDFYYRVIKNVSSIRQPNINGKHNRGTYK